MLRSVHAECKTKHDQAVESIGAAVRTAAAETDSTKPVDSEVRAIALAGRVSDATLKAVTVRGWDSALSLALEDGVLTTDEEQRLMALAERLTLSSADLDTNGGLRRAAMAAALREVIEGRIPTSLRVEGALPFNLTKTEKLVWLWQDVRYLEDQAKRVTTGGSHGVSIRLAKGVYYRPSAFKAQTVMRTETVAIDTGTLGVTTHHLYFAGPKKSFRVPYSKIVSIIPFSDGFGIHRDAATAKPQSFLTQEGWFAYNLVSNIAQGTISVVDS